MEGYPDRFSSWLRGLRISTVEIGTFCTIIATGGLRYGGSCISWGRSSFHNKEVGGHDDSFHMLWLACDIVFDTVVNKEAAAKFYRRMGLNTKPNGTRTLHIQVVAPE